MKEDMEKSSKLLATYLGMLLLEVDSYGCWEDFYRKMKREVLEEFLFLALKMLQNGGSPSIYFFEKGLKEMKEEFILKIGRDFDKWIQLQRELEEERK